MGPKFWMTISYLAETRVRTSGKVCEFRAVTSTLRRAFEKKKEHAAKYIVLQCIRIGTHQHDVRP